MYCKLSIDERRLRRGEFKENPIYCMLYAPLWRRRGNDLSPEEVWIEAIGLAFKLKKIDHTEVSMCVKEQFEDLCDQYMCFREEDGSTTKRDLEQSLHSAMMVSFAAFLLLLNVHPNADDHPYADVCDTLGKLLSDLKGFKELYKEAKREEDEREKQGKFIEVADFIEQIVIQENPLDQNQLVKARQMFGQFVEENKYCDLLTMYANERMMARVNDYNDHCLQPELDLLRKQIKEVEGNDGQNVEYRNIIFAKTYEDKVSAIRHAIYPFISKGTDHIDPKEQRQWLAIVEPLKLIEGLLIKHDDKPKHKNCTNVEICQQLREFFGKEFPDVDFDKIPKSIDAERKKWRENGVGLSFGAWHDYASAPLGNPKYKPLARIAERVYGEIIRVKEGK